MATAKKNVETVFVLSMNNEEFNALHDVLVHIGGSPVLSRRKYIDDILKAMLASGFTKAVCNDIKGGNTIYFHDMESGE